MSLKRFDGWTPTPDDPVEWDERERLWMLSLQEYENRLCPICGMDSLICHDQDRFEALHAQGRTELCFAQYERNRALGEYRDSGAPDPLAEGAITVSLAMPPTEEEISWR